MHKRHSLARRNLLRHAAASGLALLVPACSRTDAPQNAAKSAPAAGPLFATGTLRLDLRHRAMAGSESFALERLRFEPIWAGPSHNLADGPDWGDYRLTLHDAASETPVFRHGFETGLPPDARAATTLLSIRLPMLLRPFRATIEKRRGVNTFVASSTFSIDPAANDIDRSPVATPTRVDIIHANGDPGSKVDIAILGDGYREAEYAKFVNDARHAAGYLFSVEPFKARRSDFNVRAVFAASIDSGVTDPYLGLQKNTVFRSAYFSGGSERALAEGDHYVLREVASAVPYDFLLVLANARRYGGSAYFGGPAVAAIDSAAARYLVIHEFAHAIAGLADEYYVPAAGGGPTYGGNIEPWYPNVTISPHSGKWRNRTSVAASHPTAWNKAQYDEYFASHVKHYEALRANGVEEKAIEQFMAQARDRQAALLAKNGARNVGYYEGANGYAKGMYRAEADCIMFSLQTQYFCAACSAAIERIIDVHVKP